MKQKISEWLSELGSHDIYNAATIAADFHDCTGHVADWPVFTADETRRAIRDRGLGGSLSGDSDCAYGHAIASWLASKYVGNVSLKLGRGSSFWENISILKDAGF